MGEKKLLSESEEYVSPPIIVLRYGVKRSTIYDWNYRPEKYDIPDGMFKKFGANLKINLVIFENWFHRRNG